MANQEYIELLRDPRWQRKRLEKLQQANWRCARCFSSDKTLNVHHKLYRKGAMPWEYRDDELEVLCDACHKKMHWYRAEILRFLGMACPSIVESVYGYVAASGPWSSDSDFVIDVSQYHVAQGVSRALGEYSVGAVEAFGDPDWIRSNADEQGKISPRVAHEKLWELWLDAMSRLEAKKKEVG